MPDVSWSDPGISSNWSVATNWTGLLVGTSYPGQIAVGDLVTIGASNTAYVVTFDVPSATISSLTIEGGNGGNHFTTLRMTAGNTLNIQGGVTLLKKDSPAAVDGAGTISVSAGITATGPIGSEGTISAGTDTTGGVLELTGAGSITSPFVFAVGTAAPTTLEFNLAGGALSPTAITIDNVNQTLEIGPSGVVNIDAAQNVTNGRILMAGGFLTDTSGISFGTTTSSGSLSGFGTVIGPLTMSGTGATNSITATGGNLTLSTAIGSNSGLVFDIGSTDVSALQLSAAPGDGNAFTFLGSDGELALTSIAASGFDDSIVGLDVSSTLAPTNLIHILGEIVTVTSGQIGSGATGIVTLSDDAVLNLSGITNASGAWFVHTAPDGAGGTNVFLTDTVAPLAPSITSIPENGGGGINASEASDGTPVVVGLTGAGAVAGDTLTIDWGGQTVNYTLLAGDITGDSATVTVPPATITAQGQGTFDVTATLTDAAGNASSNSAAVSVTVDTLPPSVAITTIEGGDDLINAAEAAGGVTVSGTAEIGSTLTVNGAPVTVDASGAWTTSVATAGQGLLPVTAVATDAAGNTATTTRDLTVDTLPPSVAITTIEGGDDLINAAEAAGGVTVSGTAEIGSTLTVNGAPVTVDASGAWTTSVATAGQGLLPVTAVATDAAGNTATTTRDLTVDTLPPSVAITTIEGGDDLINAAEAAGGVTVSGTAEIGSTLTVNGAPVTVDASGAWTTSVATAGQGLLPVTAVATDAAGNTATTTRDLTVDTLPPSVAITTIEGGDDLINAAEAAGGVTVSGTAEIGSTLTVNGAPVTVDASGAWTTSVATAGQGLLPVTAVATDAAGNTATTTRDLTVDTLPPSVAITTIEGGDDLINAAEAAGGVTVSGTAEIGSTLTVNGAPVTVDASGAWTTSVATAGQGLLPVTAVATDAAGNTATTTRDLTVDTLPPSVAITTIEGGDDLINAAEAAGGVTVSGTAEIGSTLTVNGAPVTVDASGAWTTSVATAGQGLLPVTAVATDAAGNTATTTRDLTVDTLPPSVAITTIEGGDDLINAAEAAGGVTVSGTAEIGSTLTVNGAPVTVDASGAWTTSVATAGQGLLPVTAVATDAAGNTATTTRDLTVDTLPPSVAITTIEGGDDLINAAEAAGGVTVSGTAEIGSTLTVNGAPVTVDASGAWTTSVATAGQGLLPVTAVATDAAGNTATTTRDLTVDTLPPSVAITTIEGGDDLINAAEAAGGVTVSGTAEIGSTLTVNGAPVTVDASGAWTTSVATAGQGLLPVTAVATDAAGNTATTTRDLTVDTLPPSVAITTIEGGDDLINAAEAAGGVTVSGTAEIGSTLTVNGAPVTVDASGAWTTSVATAGQGLLPVTAVATDAAGNTATTTRDLTVDTLPPSVAITTIEGGDDLINAAEAAGGVTVSGTAEIGSTLTVNGAPVTVDASGAWTTSVATAGQGLLPVTAVATDAAGNTATTTRDLTVDTLPPSVAITTIEGGDDLINAAEAAGGVTVSGTAEIGSTLTVNGAPVTVDASGAWTTSVATAGQGLLPVTAVATDAAGNTATTTRDLTVDTLPPSVAITTIEGGDDLINAAEAAGGVTVSGTAEIGSTLTVNGAPVTVDASGAWTTSVATAGQGLLPVTAVATDAAGNTATTTRDLTVDLAPLAPSITSIPENGGGGINASEASDGTPVVVGLTGTGAVAGDKLTINWGGQTVNYTLLAGDISGNSATVTVPLATITAQGQGTFDVTATLTDAAGNASSNSAPASVTVDLAPLAPSITSIPENGGGGIDASEASDGTPVVVGLTGTGAVAGDKLTINWGGQTVNYTLLAGDISGNSATVTVPLATITAQGQGTFDVTATLTDAAGNASSNSAPASVTVDLAPLAPSITSIPENGGGGIDASEASDGTPVVVGLTGTGAVAGDKLTIDWGGQTVNYTLLAGDITGDSATVTVPPATITAQGQGTFDVTATLTDAAGNASSNSAAVSVTVDTLPPSVAITTIEGGDDLINAAEAAGGVTVSGTAEIGSTLTVNGAPVTVDASGAWTTSVATAGQGLLPVTAVATDAAGNTATTTRDLTVDTLPPSVAITTIEGGDDLINAAEAAGGVTVSGTAEIGSTLTVNGAPVTVDASGAWTTSVATAGQGLLPVTAVATDAAGNTATTTRDLTVDLAPLAPSITSIPENGGGGIDASEASDGTPVVVGLTGTGAVAGDKLTINWGGQTVNYTLLAGDISGNSATVTVPLATITAQGQGTFDVTATLTDAAGNASSNSAPASVTVDLAPLAPSITSIPENGGGGIDASEASDGTPVVVGLTGTGAVAGDKLTINWGGQTVNYTLLAGDISGNSATVTVPLATITAQGQGTFDVTATLTDAAGNASSNSAPASVTVDSTGGGSGDVHMITFDGLHYDFQAVGDFVAAQSTDPGNAWEVQIRTGSWPGAVSITTELGALVGDDRVTFAIGRKSFVDVDGAPDTVLRPGVAQTIAGGTLTEVSDDTYRMDMYGGESITVIDRGVYLDWTVALGPHDGPGSVRGLLGSNTGQTNDDFQLQDGTVLAQPLSGAEILSEFADAWTVAPGTSLLDEINAPSVGTPDSTPDRLPKADDDTGNALPGGRAAGNVLTNDSDPDGDSLAVSAVAGLSGNVGAPWAGEYGHLTLNANGSYSYVADNSAAIAAAATGSHLHDVFGYTASDGSGGTANASLDITLNRPPMAGGDLAGHSDWVASRHG